MENNPTEKYIKLLTEDEDLQISITQKTLLDLINIKNITSNKSYKLLNSLGGISGLLTKLNTYPSIGLNEEDQKSTKKRIELFGSNNITIPFSKNFLDCFLEILNQKIFLFLIFTATFRLVIDLWEQKGKWFDYTIIYIPVLILCLAMSIIEYSKEKVFENFQKNIDTKIIRVLRGNEEKLISNKNLLVGDILIINSGEIIPVDGIIIKTYSVTIDQHDKILCFHNIDYRKHSNNPADCHADEYPFVLSGCSVVKGYAYFLVLSVGNNTFLNKLTRERYNKNNKNNLKKEIENLPSYDDQEKEYEIFGDDINENNFQKNNFSDYINNTNQENNSQEEFSKNSSDSNHYTEPENNKNFTPKKSIKNLLESIPEEKDSNLDLQKINLNKLVENNNNKIVQPIKQNSLILKHRESLRKNNKEFNQTDNLNSENKKNILDYEDEYNKMTQTTKKNVEIRSGLFRNKSFIANLAKKEVVNVRSKDKRYTNFEFFYISPLQSKIEIIQDKLSELGILASVISGLSYLLTYIFISHPDDYQISKIIEILIDAILYGLVLIVLVVPEGLPLTSTLSAAFSIYKMREENTIIKSIQACENLATLNCICLDFNSVFTKNEMKITKIFVENEVFEERKLRSIQNSITEPSFEFLCEAISVTTIAYSAKDCSKGGKVEFHGDAVETSLLKFLKEIKINYGMYRNNSRREILNFESYNSENKISYTIMEIEGKLDYVRVYIRGNPKELLDSLGFYVNNDQKLEVINPKFNEKIKMFCKDMTKEGSLPILLCYKDILKDSYIKTYRAYIDKEFSFLRSILSKLNLISIVCLKDEIRTDIKYFIREFNKAGIIVKMLTSQDKEIAKLTGEKCGILKQTLKIHNLINLENNFSKKNIEEKNSNTNLLKLLQKQENSINSQKDLEILDCQEDLKKIIDLKKKRSFLNNNFHSFEFYINDISKFEKIIQNSKIICKATAKDKYILISTLKKNGYVVGVTGDSVSDSLAMKSAQVSISMGYKASDMTKESADVILCDNSFKNILTGIIYGRNIYNSVRKFIQFQITATVAIISIALICSLPVIKFYLYPPQLLWLNFILDTLGSISLASELPDKDQVLSKKPYSNKKSIITETMKVKIFIQATWQIILVIFIVIFSPIILNVKSDMGLKYIDWDEMNGFHTTIVFTCLVYLQIFNGFISRILGKNKIDFTENLLKHKIFIFIQFLILVLHYLIVTYGYMFIRSQPLSFGIHLLCFVISASVLACLPIVKYISNRRKNN